MWFSYIAYEDESLKVLCGICVDRAFVDSFGVKGKLQRPFTDPSKDIAETTAVTEEEPYAIFA